MKLLTLNYAQDLIPAEVRIVLAKQFDLHTIESLKKAKLLPQVSIHFELPIKRKFGRSGLEYSVSIQNILISDAELMLSGLSIVQYAEKQYVAVKLSSHQFGPVITAKSAYFVAIYPEDLVLRQQIRLLEDMYSPHLIVS